MSEHMFTSEELEAFMDQQRKLRMRCGEVLSAMTLIRTGEEVRYRIDEDDDISLDAGNVSIVCPARDKWDDERYYQFPISYLYNDDWHDELSKKIESEAEAKRLKEEEKTREAQEERERMERATYECLREKYGSKETTQ